MAVTDFIYDYQALIAGLLALAAAWIASNPARKQVKQMTLQTKVMSIDLYDTKISKLKQIISNLEIDFGDIETSLWRQIYTHGLGDEEPKPLNIEFAFNMEKEVASLSRNIKKLLQSKILPHEFDQTLEEFISSLEDLEKYLNEIHFFHSFDFDDPDYLADISDLDTEKEKWKQKSEDAQLNLGGALSSASDMKKKLIQEVEKQESKLLKLRQGIFADLQ